MTRRVRAYRISATQGGTHVNILLACYDAVAEDIRFAGRFAVEGDVVPRCRYSEHALLLIGHLESWVSLLDDSELAESLTSFAPNFFGCRSAVNLRSSWILRLLFAKPEQRGKTSRVCNDRRLEQVRNRCIRWVNQTARLRAS